MPPAPPDAPRIVIAGFGLLSPLGQSAWETFAALLAGRSIADRCAHLVGDLTPVDVVRLIGTVKLAQHAAIDPTVELAERAAREAAAMAGVPTDGLPAFVGTSKGAIGALMPDPRAPSYLPPSQRVAEAIALGPAGYLSHHLRTRLRLSSTRHYIAACASSLTALHHARQHLLTLPTTPGLRSAATKARVNGPSHALVLTAESALHPLFIHSYRRLGVLAETTAEGYRQRPLDERRQGFMLSEFGAALLLRRLEPGEAPRPGELELLATATAMEADDLIRPSPTMPSLAHVARTLFAQTPPIDVLHPHAPGTPDHDRTELQVLAEATRTRGSQASSREPQAPPRPAPDLYACKGALGHGLGAAGLVSLVLACLCLTTGKRPPMPWLEQPLPGAEGSAPARPCSRTGTHAVFAAGFGSHVAGAVIRRW